MIGCNCGGNYTVVTVTSRRGALSDLILSVVCFMFSFLLLPIIPCVFLLVRCLYRLINPKIIHYKLCNTCGNKCNLQ